MNITEIIQGAEADAAGSNSLPVLAASIKANIVKSKESREAWIEAELHICVELAEARSRFPDNDLTGFGKWLDENKVDISKDDRAAYIAMGKEPERALQVLTATTRSSVRMIFAHEWAIRSAAKSSPKGKSAKPSVEFEKAKAAIDRREAAGEPYTMEDIKAEAGVSATPVRRAYAAKQAEEDAAKVEDIILSASAQKRFDAKLKAYQKQLDATYQDKLTKAVLQWAEEYKIPDYLKTLEAMRKLLERKTKGIMPRSDFTKIRACLHADSVHRSKEKLDEAFKLFSSHEDLLVMDKQSPMIAEIFEMPLTADAIRAARRRRA